MIQYYAQSIYKIILFRMKRKNYLNTLHKF